MDCTTACAPRGPGYGDPVSNGQVAEEDFHYGFSREDFIAAVGKSKEYILSGDIFQVVLSQRMSVPFQRPSTGCLSRVAGAEPLSLYVLYRPGRYPDRGFFAGSAGEGAEPESHFAPDCRNPSSRRDRGRRPAGWKPNCWPIPKSVPNT